jgi:cell division protein FtsL
LGVSLYQVKHLITKKEMKLAQIQNNIKNAQSNIKILKAELSYLKRPDRIEKIALNKLGLREVSPTEIWNLKDLVDATDILSNGKNK